MWLLKRTIDPKGLMNPGKVLPEISEMNNNSFIGNNLIVDSDKVLNIQVAPDKKLSLTIAYDLRSKL